RRASTRRTVRRAGRRGLPRRWLWNCVPSAAPAPARPERRESGSRRQERSACAGIYPHSAKRPTEIRVKGGGASALAGLEARRGLVDDVDAALAANHAVVAVTALERLERVLDLHRSSPFFLLLRPCGPT